MKKHICSRLSLMLVMGLAFISLLSAEETTAPRKLLTDSQSYEKAEKSLVNYFQNDFMKSQDFIDTFGEVTWADIADGVTDSIDITRDRETEDTLKNHRFYLVGYIWDLYTEIELDDATGEVKNIHIDLDQ